MSSMCSWPRGPGHTHRLLGGAAPEAHALEAETWTLRLGGGALIPNVPECNI